MKKMTALILAAILMAATSAAIAAERMLPRNEIPALKESDHQAQALYSLGIMSGTGNGLELEKNLTRAEALIFIWHTTGVTLEDHCFDAPPFNDLENHWARDVIEKFYGEGLISSTESGSFEPNGTITGREFLNVLLKAMGYDNVTEDNAYELGKECGILSDNFTKSVVYDGKPLTRGDAVRICYSSLIAFTPEKKMLYRTLIENGGYNESDFEGTLFVSDIVKASSFSEKIANEMPKDTNYMFSPFSIKTALALAANGAEGETKAEILASLGIADLDAFNERALDLIEGYEKSELISIKTANSLWINESRTDQKFSGKYFDTALKYFKAKADIVNDQNAVDKINSWVSEKTEGKINSVIDSSDFWSMIVNAVYFNGRWQDEFSENATQKAPFTSYDGSISEIDFMNRRGYYNYYGSENVTVVKLPYRSALDYFNSDGEIESARSDFAASMYLVMSEDEVDEAEFIENAPFKRSYLDLSLPKFKFEYETNLNDILKSIGINKAFTDKAEFEAMFDKGNMAITSVVHKTYVDVNEKGTEAAAVTAIAMAGSSLPPEPVKVSFDRPFTFIIRDDTNGEVLFFGRFAAAG